MLRELELSYRGGGGGKYYPDPQYRYKLSYASAITLTITYPAEHKPEELKRSADDDSESTPLGRVDIGGKRSSARLRLA